MRDVVLDASVVLKWFRTEDEQHVEEAHELRGQFESGELVVIVPRLLTLEVLNVAARRWAWEERALVDLVATLRKLRFEVGDPEPELVARWAARGLTAYDAVYVALAEEEGIDLVTDDDLIVGVAAAVAVPLGASGSSST